MKLSSFVSAAIQRLIVEGVGVTASSMYTIFNVGTLKIFGGSPPATADDPETGIVLAIFAPTYYQEPTGPYTGDTALLLAASPWATTAILAGTPTHYRYYDQNGNVLAQGTAGSGAVELSFATPTFSVGQALNITDFTIGFSITTSIAPGAAVAVAESGAVRVWFSAGYAALPEARRVGDRYFDADSGETWAAVPYDGTPSPGASYQAAIAHKLEFGGAGYQYTYDDSDAGQKLFCVDLEAGQSARFAVITGSCDCSLSLYGSRYSSEIASGIEGNGLLLGYAGTYDTVVTRDIVDPGRYYVLVTLTDLIDKAFTIEVGDVTGGGLGNEPNTAADTSGGLVWVEQEADPPTTAETAYDAGEALNIDWPFPAAQPGKYGARVFNNLSGFHWVANPRDDYGQANALASPAFEWMQSNPPVVTAAGAAQYIRLPGCMPVRGFFSSVTPAGAVAYYKIGLFAEDWHPAGSVPASAQLNIAIGFAGDVGLVVEVRDAGNSATYATATVSAPASYTLARAVTYLLRVRIPSPAVQYGNLIGYEINLSWG